MGLYSCAIGGCDEKTYRKTGGVKFFYLKSLKDEATIKAWKDRILSTRSDIKYRWQINDIAICSRHFIDGDKRNIPSIIPKTDNKNRVVWPVKKERRKIVRKLNYSPKINKQSTGTDNVNFKCKQTTGSSSTVSTGVILDLPLTEKLSSIKAAVCQTPPKEVIIIVVY